MAIFQKAEQIHWTYVADLKIDLITSRRIYSSLSFQNIAQASKQTVSVRFALKRTLPRQNGLSVLSFFALQGF